MSRSFELSLKPVPARYGAVAFNHDLTDVLSLDRYYTKFGTYQVEDFADRSVVYWQRLAEATDSVIHVVQNDGTIILDGYLGRGARACQFVDERMDEMGDEDYAGGYKNFSWPMSSTAPDKPQ